MFYEKRTLKKEERQKVMKAELKFFFKVCLSAGWRLGGEQRAEGYLARHSCSSSTRKKKTWGHFNGNYDFKQKKQTKKHNLRMFMKCLNWTYLFIRIHNTVLQQWFSAPLSLLCGRQGWKPESVWLTDAVYSLTLCPHHKDTYTRGCILC